LAVVGEKTVMLGIQRDGFNNWLVLRTDNKMEKLRSVTSRPVKLRVEVRMADRSPSALPTRANLFRFRKHFGRQKANGSAQSWAYTA